MCDFHKMYKCVNTDANYLSLKNISYIFIWKREHKQGEWQADELTVQ